MFQKVSRHEYWQKLKRKSNLIFRNIEVISLLLSNLFFKSIIPMVTRRQKKAGRDCVLMVKWTYTKLLCISCVFKTTNCDFQIPLTTSVIFDRFWQLHPLMSGSEGSLAVAFGKTFILISKIKLSEESRDIHGNK